MRTFIESVKALWRDEDGLEMTEYAVVGTVVVIVATTAFTSLGNQIVIKINAIATTLGA